MTDPVMTSVVPGTVVDITAIMTFERGEGFSTLVGRWTRAEHEAEMARPGSHYLVARRAGEAEGFALLQRLDDPNDCALLRRIAVRRPGEGLGAALLTAALGHAFLNTGTHRLELRVYPENARAWRAYERAGFRKEGLARDVARTPDGRYRSMLTMAILRPDWEVLRRKR